MLISFALGTSGAPVPENDATKLLPAKVGEYNGTPIKVASGKDDERLLRPADVKISAVAGSIYRHATGAPLETIVELTQSDSAAYILLKWEAKNLGGDGAAAEWVPGIGSLAYRVNDTLIFFKGPAVVQLTGQRGSADKVAAFAGDFAAKLPDTDSDIPALIKHLPDWQRVEPQAAYYLSLETLKAAFPSQPVLDAVEFTGGTEAVVAPYDKAQLAIVEFTTPQIASDNDSRIRGRIAELKNQGAAIPSLYRRVGNYGVFVFDAPDAQTAENLAKGVSYEQVVQWLGNNPNILRRAQKAYVAGTAGIILAVIKASGISLLASLGIGGLFGAYVFRQRRRKLAALNTYSDAGGMIRLNIDDLNVQSNPNRLIGDGDS